MAKFCSGQRSSSATRPWPRQDQRERLQTHEKPLRPGRERDGLTANPVGHDLAGDDPGVRLRERDEVSDSLKGSRGTRMRTHAPDRREEAAGAGTVSDEVARRERTEERPHLM